MCDTRQVDDSKFDSDIAFKTDKGYTVDITDIAPQNEYVDYGNENGSLEVGKGKITIKKGAKRGEAVALGHEAIGEVLRAYNRTDYNTIVNAILDYAAQETSTKSTAELINAYYNTYYKDDSSTTIEDAKEEFANDLISALFFGNEQGQKQFVEYIMDDKTKTAKEKKTFLEKIKDLIDKIIASIKKAVNTNAFSEQEKAIAEMEIKKATEFRKQILEALDKAVNNQNGIEADNTIKYSINPDFVNEYDKWDKKNSRVIFNLGTTSNILQNLGLKNTKITIDSSKIIKIKSKHREMTDSVIKQIPYLLENPIVVMKSKSVKGRLTLFGEVYTKDNRPVLAVLELFPKDRNNITLDEFKVASAYGKDNAQQFINNSDILYVDNNKKRVRNWEKRTRLQLPVGISQSNSTNSIPKSTTNVKKFSLDVDSEGNKLSEQQQEYFKNSQVRDANGNLQVVYHGTSNEFTVFDNSAVRYSNQGYYFTENKYYANGYSQGTGKVLKGYINITKPFDLSNKEVRNIFVNDYIKGGYAQGISPYSTNAEISAYIENGIDWTEGDNLIDFIEENELDYDGLVLNEGADSVANAYGNETISRGQGYVIFNSNQFKNADNLNPTTNEDIRYSRDVDDFDLSECKAIKLDKYESWRVEQAVADKYNASKNTPEYFMVYVFNPKLKIDNAYAIRFRSFGDYDVISKGKKSDRIKEKLNENNRRRQNNVSDRRNETAEYIRREYMRYAVIFGNGRTDGQDDFISSEQQKHDRGKNAESNNDSNSRKYSKDVELEDTRSLVKRNKQLQESVEYFKRMSKLSSTKYKNAESVKTRQAHQSIKTTLILNRE